ncbi:hypothetical protein [Clostridium beijerinckii]|uniref:hypothetical protein n=1 Tax=Clostridium beijerinckii TaxID=1520 RepID=UPI0015C875B2|nr:hypothetical protein [Clostridium beijerinckii]
MILDENNNNSKGAINLRTNKILEIFNLIEETDIEIIMLLNAEYSKDEKELIVKYTKAYNKEVRFVKMKEFIFNKDNNILKFK